MRSEVPKKKNNQRSPLSRLKHLFNRLWVVFVQTMLINIKTGVTRDWTTCNLIQESEEFWNKNKNATASPLEFPAVGLFELTLVCCPGNNCHELQRRIPNLRTLDPRTNLMDFIIQSWISTPVMGTRLDCLHETVPFLVEIDCKL